MKALTFTTSIFPTALKDMRGSIAQWEKRDTFKSTRGPSPTPHTTESMFFCAALSPADLLPVEQSEVNKT